MRIIGRLDIKNSNLIKGVNLEGLRKVGDPNDFALKYYESGIDELIFMDSVASLYGRNNLNNIIKAATKDIFIPITVGGGVRSIYDAEIIFNSGADKIAINTAAVDNPNLINLLAKKYGSQSIVLSVEAKKKSDLMWEVFTHNGRESTNIDVIDWVKKAEQLGAGEILLTSVDKEGTREGFDLDLINSTCESVNLPIIASGGFGKISHLRDLCSRTKCDAVAVAYAIHYDKVKIESIREELLELGQNIRKF
ncbi:MAG: imidazole glycerol phosphate synthase subunit HisF [Candidatus Marinimicrobia bacterium]|nr:imidazole glycerol phosphate synthase subunit HisF [Candidatus Neomarinimicrobiota bacterium]|tara:strand:- start:458 stop:1210 length:753 start_codon:yes stop_codon:yes gene_type:complete